MHEKASWFFFIRGTISVVIAGIALLGLAAAQIKSLQYATNSFHYTVSLIQGQNSIERIWPRICEIQKLTPHFSKMLISEQVYPKSLIMKLRFLRFIMMICKLMLRGLMSA